jgi:hypothetical protein
MHLFQACSASDAAAITCKVQSCSYGFVSARACRRWGHTTIQKAKHFRFDVIILHELFETVGINRKPIAHSGPEPFKRGGRSHGTKARVKKVQDETKLATFFQAPTGALVLSV